MTTDDETVTAEDQCQPVIAETTYWGAPTPLGGFRAITGLGSVAAPLLAGASVTVAAVVLSNPEKIRLSDVSLTLFVTSAVFFVFEVQTSLWLTSFAATPSDFAEWYPQLMEKGLPRGKAVTLHESWSAKSVWYARLTRWLHNLGVLALLAGVTTVVVPPNSEFSIWRCIAIAVPAAGWIIEFGWIVIVRAMR
jgi:hypothetical protein